MIANLTQPLACEKEGGRDNDDEKCGNDRKRSNVDSGMSIIHSSNAMYRLNPSFLQQSATMVFLKYPNTDRGCYHVNHHFCDHPDH